MKYVILILSVVIILLFIDRCNTAPEKIDLKPLKAKLVDLKKKDKEVVSNYENKKIIKDSVLIQVKTKYLTFYDTLECLPKPQVDTIINIYENIIKDCDTIILVKDSIIVNLEEQGEIKDNILKKEKKKKWKFGLVGGAVGWVVGKIF